MVIAGCDEVGRGPLAGDVVAAAVSAMLSVPKELLEVPRPVVAVAACSIMDG